MNRGSSAIQSKIAVKIELPAAGDGNFRVGVWIESSCEVELAAYNQVCIGAYIEREGSSENGISWYAANGATGHLVVRILTILGKSASSVTCGLGRRI
ncbi:MAG: hypothetical protein RMJ57_03255 [Bacteroidia bacterium]|nr:hypothetical protein [Bacteroidia bacterium]